MEPVALANSTVASTAGAVDFVIASSSAAATSTGVEAVEACPEGGPILGSLH